MAAQKKGGSGSKLVCYFFLLKNVQSEIPIRKRIVTLMYLKIMKASSTREYFKLLEYSSVIELSVYAVYKLSVHSNQSLTARYW